MKKTAGEKLFDVLVYFFAGLLGLITAAPFLYMLAGSVTPVAIRAGGASFRITLENYRRVFHLAGLLNGFRISFLVTGIGTALATVTTTMLGYALSRKSLPGRGFVNRLILLTMFVSGGMIPTYLTIKALGLLNSIWCLIFPLSYSAWNTMLMRSAFSSMSETLEESAQIDGASDRTIAFRIMFPLAKPVIASIALFYAADYWTDWRNAQLYIKYTGRLYPLAMVIRNINAGSLDMRMTVLVVTTVPILCVYPFILRYFQNGLMIGSLKG